MSILQMSISAGILIIVTVIIRAVALNRLPKTTFLILWGVALCRSLIPFSIPSRISVYSVIEGIFSRIRLDTHTSVIENALPADGFVTGVAEELIPAAQGQVFAIDPIAMVWFIGMFTMLIFFGMAYFKNHSELRFALPIRHSEFLDKWLREHRMMRPVTLLQSDRITTPVAVGIVRPRIILPKYMNMRDEQLMQYVLAHEYYHIRRFDMLWKILLTATLCVHWFNPFVWVMFVLATRDLELTCDELVVRHFGAKIKTAYAYSLISMAEQRSKFTPLYNGFSKNAAEERIVSIMKMKKTTVFSLILAVLIILGTTGAFATSAGTSSDTPSATYGVIEDANWRTVPNTATAQELLSEYRAHGVTFDEEGKMRFNGELVRYFWDGYLVGDYGVATRYEYLNEDGAIDLSTKREVIDNGDGSVNPFGELIEIVKNLPVNVMEAVFADNSETSLDAVAYIVEDVPESYFDTSPNAVSHVVEEVAESYLEASPNAVTYNLIEDVSEASGITIAEKFSRYKGYGITYKERAGSGVGNVYYNGQLVKLFIDEDKDGGVFSYRSADGGEITVYTIYDENRELIGVERR